MLIAEAKVPRLLLHGDSLMVTEELSHVVDLSIVLGAEVLVVVDAVPVRLVSADCAVLDVRLGVLEERVDLDLGCDLVEETYLLAVVDGVCVGELACGLLLILKED